MWALAHLDLCSGDAWTMMSTAFVVTYALALGLIYEIYLAVEWYLDRRAQKRYARNHFERNERFRNGIQ